MLRSSNVESEPWLTFFWNIQNFSYCWQKNDECIHTPSFKAGLTEKTTWKYALSPREGITKDIRYCMFGKCADGSRSIDVEIDLALLAEDGSILQTTPRERKIIRKDWVWASSKFVKRDEVMKTKRNRYLSRDTLRIRCRVWKVDGKTVTPATFYATTILRITTRYFHCDVERFGALQSNHDVIYVLSSESEDEKAILKVGVNREDKVTISINFFCKLMKFLVFQSFVVDTNDRKIDCGKSEILRDNFRNATCTVPFDKKYLMDNKNSYLKNDALSLFLECSWCDGFFCCGIERISFGRRHIDNDLCLSNSNEDQMDSAADLKKDMGFLYTEGIFTDVKLCTPTTSFRAHKAILSARSPVFRAMFATDMKEKIEKRVYITDLEDDIIHKMLRYVYSNALEGVHWEKAFKLYPAADKYQIMALKRKCSALLKSSLCLNNVCEILSLADLHADEDLKKAVQDYAFTNEMDVFASNKWTDFMKNNVTLAAETMVLKWKRKTDKVMLKVNSVK
ncbi:speckle-type POZ protein-like [Trichonephila clavata]|uniref:Speckle-type POZ protein-like n=1 Tax=Trichonephila clavata TaxID=2740835 RepID=A0A8X6H9S6_TRICU|nr:speckle-type POZ protein-like [Trichonephila clavata]